MKNDYSYSEDEILFKKVNQLLRSIKCEYWVCHGTLLGIIRDNMILPFLYIYKINYIKGLTVLKHLLIWNKYYSVG